MAIKLMATKKPTKKTSRKTSKNAAWHPPRKYRYVLPASTSFDDIFRYLVLVVLVIVGVRVTINYTRTQIVYNRDKVVFAQAEKDLDEARDAIIAKVGEPYQVKKNHVCSYTALKFRRGPLSCAVSVQLVYGVEDEAKGKELLQTMMDNLNGKHHFGNNYDASPAQIERVESWYMASFKSSRKMDCQMMYEINEKAYFNDTTSDINDYNDYTGDMPLVADYSVACSRYTPRALYEIDKDTL